MNTLIIALFLHTQCTTIIVSNSYSKTLAMLGDLVPYLEPRITSTLSNTKLFDVRDLTEGREVFITLAGENVRVICEDF